ncbi:MAG TPA: ERCC4 domain-containing protein [Candidatus Limnocylindrales bacterium]|nr:ERCC4 domain-containing protein [Candidatus Limnocylindrales bacterium]
MIEVENGGEKRCDCAPVLIFADDREAGSPVPAALKQIPGINLQFKRLAVGDYLVNGRCVFERKTVADFAASVIDGRLFTQAGKLARLSIPAALILEGRLADLAQVQVRRESLQGAMICLSLIFRLPVLRALGAAESASLMMYAAQQTERREEICGARYGRRPKRKRRLQLHILQGLPGIGPGRAAQLLATFGTVEAVMTASRQNLEQVQGIGAKTAAMIRDVLRESPRHYGNSPSPNLDI